MHPQEPDKLKISSQSQTFNSNIPYEVTLHNSGGGKMKLILYPRSHLRMEVNKHDYSFTVEGLKLLKEQLDRAIKILEAHNA